MTRDPNADLLSCYDLARAYLSSRPAPVADYIAPLPENPAFVAPSPLALPSGTGLAETCKSVSPSTQPLAKAILKAAGHLRWQQGYSEKDVGADFLQRYGWCHLAGPEGPFVVQGTRLFLGYWGAGLDYQEHWHEAEELYLPIAGGGQFRVRGQAPHWAGPGDAVFHASNQPHATVMGQSGLLALILWRGPNLAMSVTIEPRS